MIPMPWRELDGTQALQFTLETEDGLTSFLEFNTSIPVQSRCSFTEHLTKYDTSQERQGSCRL